MKGVVVTAAAVRTALGDLEGTWEGLLAGRSAIAPVRRFDPSRYVAQQAACIRDLDAGEERSRVHRLLDLLLEGFVPVPADAALVTATTKWGIDSLERRKRGLAACDADLIPGRMPEIVARRLGLRAEGGLNVSAACASSTIALARAGAMIASGAAEAVVVCCVDLVSEFVFSGFSALRGLSPTLARPFDRRRDGLTLGEGGAVLLLMSRQRAEAEGLAPLATLAGWGTAGDAFHITAPARDGSGLAQAIRAALARARRQPEEVAGISAHGTGTLYNDAMELAACAAVFGDREVPFHSVKGAIGHTLGAAGGIEAALAIRSLREGLLPPTVGCGEPEEAAQGRVGEKALPLKGGVVLSTNSGFGGINAALVLEREEERHAR